MIRLPKKTFVAESNEIQLAAVVIARIGAVTVEANLNDVVGAEVRI